MAFISKVSEEISGSSDLTVDSVSELSNSFSIIIKNLLLDDTITIKNVMPSDSVSDNLSSPKFTPYSILGRSSSPQSYTGGGERTVSFSLKLHRDLFKDFNGLINRLKALNYPKYTEAGVQPPSVFVKIGNSVSIKGFASVSIVYDSQPIDNDKRFMSATASIEITEIVDKSWSANEVEEGDMSKSVNWYAKHGR